MWLRKIEGKKDVYPFLLLENSRTLSPPGPQDFLSTCLGIDCLRCMPSPWGEDSVRRPVPLSPEVTEGRTHRGRRWIWGTLGCSPTSCCWTPWHSWVLPTRNETYVRIVPVELKFPVLCPQEPRTSSLSYAGITSQNTCHWPGLNPPLGPGPFSKGAASLCPSVCPQNCPCPFLNRVCVGTSVYCN